MINKIFLHVSLTLFLFSSCNASAGGPKTYKPEEHHSIVFQTALQFAASYHFSKPAINDAFSIKAFDNYISDLDPQKVYFTQSDINSFQRYRTQIDDAMISGQIAFMFDIFNLYQERLFDRIDFAISLLTDSFDFSIADSFQYNREHASWILDFGELDNLWKRKVKYESMLIAVTGKHHEEYSETIRKRYLNLKKMYEKTKNEDVFQIIMNSILEVTDPHTNYFSPRTAEDFNQSMTLSLEGIGAQLQTENEYTKIREIIKGGPAEKSKQLHAGDRIIGVAQGKDSDIVNVIDWRIDEVVSLIRGKKGSVVKLEVIPANEPNKTKIVILTRDKIMLEDQSAKSSVKEVVRNGKMKKIGVISIPTFYMDFAAAAKGESNYKSTTRDVKKLITDLKKQKVEGIIIDLRNNGGGSLQEAVELTGLFIPQGPVVQIKDMMGSIRQEMDKDNGAVFYDGPLVVLVNRFSASASEIFAGAIQDYNRGIIVGERTFGKGTVQQVQDLSDFIKIGDKKVGQVKITLAKFYRVSGSSTQHRGVTPDLLLPSIFDGRKYGEDASEYALAWDQINSTLYLKYADDIERNKLRDAHKKRVHSNIEYQYLLEDLDEVKAYEQRQFITLNMDNYKLDNDIAEDKKKQREAYRNQQKSKNADARDLILTEGEEVIIDMLMMRK
jgi:carboxyl-terminal processing protease